MVCWVLDCLRCALVSQRIETSTSCEVVPQIAVLWLPHVPCVVEHASHRDDHNYRVACHVRVARGKGCHHTLSGLPQPSSGSLSGELHGFSQC